MGGRGITTLLLHEQHCTYSTTHISTHTQHHRTAPHVQHHTYSSTGVTVFMIDGRAWISKPRRNSRRCLSTTRDVFHSAIFLTYSPLFASFTAMSLPPGTRSTTSWPPKRCVSALNDNPRPLLSMVFRVIQSRPLWNSGSSSFNSLRASASGAPRRER